MVIALFEIITIKLTILAVNINVLGVSLNKKNISIFGRCWPEVEGVVYLIQESIEFIYVSTYYTVESFFSSSKEGTIIILAVKPHESAYFIHQVSLVFSGSKILVLADKFYFSDKVVLNALNITGFTFEEFIKFKFCQIVDLPDNKPHTLNFRDKDRFIRYINQKILINLDAEGVSLAQRKVLSLIVKGYSNARIGMLMNISNKTVSTHKINGLMKLPYPKDRLSLSRGLRVNCNISTHS